MKKVKQFLFGIRVKGETLSNPSPSTVDLIPRPDYFNWCKQMNVSIRYNKTQERWADTVADYHHSLITNK